MINWDIPSPTTIGGGLTVPLPTYGRYGGQNYTGGKIFGNDYSLPGIDALDELFREHDIAYRDAAGDPDLIRAADRALVDAIDALRSSPNWQDLDGESRAYADFAQGFFGDDELASAWAAFRLGLAANAEAGSLLRSIAAFAALHPFPLLALDPLVLDLDGNGVALTSVQDSSAHFDYGGTGFAPKTGWVGAGDGILVRDINNDSAVTANELFGATSGNGFNDLAALDGNSDGKVDAGDTAFADLKVWQDADGDGVANAGELSSLSAAGIAAINLTRQQSGANINGNVVVETATFTRTDNSTSTIAEVNFATDALYSRYTPPAAFQYSQSAFLLPALAGYGNVPDLIYSMSLDSSIEDTVHEDELLSLAARNVALSVNANSTRNSAFN